MTKNMDESIKRQLVKKMTHFTKYFPCRIKNVGEDAIANRQLMWDFKDGKAEATEQVAQMTANYLREEFGEHVAELLFVAVPASSQAKNESRYKKFCKRVSEQTGIANGFEHIKVAADRLAVHENRRNKKLSTAAVLDFDADFFKGKQIVCMDDCVTTGVSYATFANKLEELGGYVLERCFLG